MSKCFPILWKVGRGGAEGVALPAPVAEVEDVSRADIDVDEADRNIERERARAKEDAKADLVQQVRKRYRRSKVWYGAWIT